MPHSSSYFGFNVPSSRSYERGKFGRLLPSLPPAYFDEELINAIAKKMKRAEKVSPTVDIKSMPAGYTYLGQFITHDISFDPTSISERQIDPEFLWNFRTPALDLDSMYGAHPRINPIYYASEKGFFLLGPEGNDLFRKPTRIDGPPEMAVIPDPRNDENKIIAQIHLLFQKLHNRILREKGNFEEAQKLTKWHYQWIVLKDYMARILDEEIYEDMFSFKDPCKVKRKYYDWRNEPFIPVEFAAAAFRFGHSQVRDEYQIDVDENDRIKKGVMIMKQNFSREEKRDQILSLMGRQTGIDSVQLTSFFGPDAQPNHLIQPKISASLYNISHFPGVVPLNSDMEYSDSLPYRTITRGMQLGLPSGESVAKAFNQVVLDIDFQKGDPDFDVPSYDPEYNQTPLWYYILHEAEAFSQNKERPNKLGPLGSTIVGEVIIGLLQGDKNSYINQDPKWESPYWGEDFDMAKLVEGIPGEGPL